MGNQGGSMMGNMNQSNMMMGNLNNQSNNNGWNQMQNNQADKGQQNKVQNNASTNQRMNPYATNNGPWQSWTTQPANQNNKFQSAGNNFNSFSGTNQYGWKNNNQNNVTKKANYSKTSFRGNDDKWSDEE